MNSAPLAQHLHHAGVEAAVADLHLLERLDVHVDHHVLPDGELHGAAVRVSIAQDGQVTQVHPAPFTWGQAHDVNLQRENGISLSFSSSRYSPHLSSVSPAVHVVLFVGPDDTHHRPES